MSENPFWKEHFEIVKAKAPVCSGCGKYIPPCDILEDRHYVKVDKNRYEVCGIMVLPGEVRKDGDNKKDL